ncbi:CPBP family intramembrane glutamic endopeptidase [Natrarchaeobaculum sulfurireducens]|uniref:Metal-dependent membrane protease, CAAX family n=1 Tax=Natrarchaeobaculum sulfurireducens TaxID=2044521 RepID=A0A346PJN0_9EURY|nr:CPBP family intramembrane glutamic endopeptidase [Natrarchaeobaculum sulfurireducens]AXR79725.1 Metal-dependent membrane protease, CAAX family [Natrarchaeobaculum sulfurireducens]AXR83465.1 hypothetical protein AArcMg_3491 [Natrarchaeobaculum sulfurireducens]
MDSSPQRLEDGPLRAMLVAFGLAVFGIAATQVTTYPVLVLEPAIAGAPAETPIATRTAFFVLNFLGFALAGAIYLQTTGRGWSFVDLRWPTERDWLYLAGGSLVAILFFVVVSVLIQLLQLPAAESQVLEFVGDDQTMILVMIAIVFLFNAPAEEFLFRNVIQKRLYAAFSRIQAVVAASVIFAAVHLPVYVIYAESALATAVSLSVIFGGSVIFGYLYAKTDNLLVPTAAHAVFNAVQFGLLYVALEFDLEGAETPSILFDALAVVAVAF